VLTLSRQGAETRIAAARRHRSRSLDLGNLGLDDDDLAALMPGIAALSPYLTTLNLTGNGLTALPDTLGQLTALTTLNLAANELTALPEALGQLIALRSLSLQRNRLRMLP
jgi:Leucine-rich repeat (LRR) protein